jgi:hypothetical protein
MQLLMLVLTYLCAAEGCRKVVHDRVINEMLGGIQDSTGGGWKVLVLDSTTTRILSAAMRMSDILEAGTQQQTCRASG